MSEVRSSDTAPALSVDAATAAQLELNAAAAHASVDALRIWQRFPIRLSGVYGGLVFIVITLMAVVFHVRGVHSEIAALQARLRAIAVTMSRAIPPPAVAALNEEADGESAEYTRLLAYFKGIAHGETDIVSIYVLRPTDVPGQLRFAVDWQREGREAAKVGEPYDASALPRLVEGLTHPTVDDEPTQDEWGFTLSGYAPIRDAAGQSIGLVGVDVSAASVEKLKEDVRRLTLSVYLVAALLLGFMALFVGKLVREPLGRIIDATTAIARGQLEVRAKLDRPDEFGILGRHFDFMATGLQEREFIRETFGRYVSEDVARKILATREGGALGGEEREVTVLTTDLASYSTISERLAPKEVVQLLNAYLGAMGELIDKHQGCVIEFLGDSILCVFGAPGDLPDHPRHAVQCALDMRAKLDELNREWERTGLSKLWISQGIPELQARIGIHTGRVVAGNLGSRSRVKYAVIGDAVNVASRAEQLNKETKTAILVTDETYQRLPDALKSRGVEKGVHQLKGRERSIKVWTL